jgi:hypothetical protein
VDGTRRHVEGDVSWINICRGRGGGRGGDRCGARIFTGHIDMKKIIRKEREGRVTSLREGLYCIDTLWLLSTMNDIVIPLILLLKMTICLTVFLNSYLYLISLNIFLCRLSGSAAGAPMQPSSILSSSRNTRMVSEEKTA